MTLCDIAAAVLLLPSAFVSAVLLHELGHLAGGHICGYRFVLLSIFCFSVGRDGDGWFFRRDARSVAGQCVMCPDRGDENGVLLVVGGCLANLAAGVLLFTAALLIKPLSQSLFAAVSGAVNMAIGISNLWPSRGGSSDGATLREIIKGTRYMEMYNSLMTVSARLACGESFGEMRDIRSCFVPEADSLITVGFVPEAGSSITAELLLYSYYSYCDRSLFRRGREEKLKRRLALLAIISRSTVFERDVAVERLILGFVSGDKTELGCAGILGVRESGDVVKGLSAYCGRHMQEPRSALLGCLIQLQLLEASVMAAEGGTIHTAAYLKAVLSSEKLLVQNSQMRLYGGAWRSAAGLAGKAIHRKLTGGLYGCIGKAD